MEKNPKLYDFYRNLDRALFVEDELRWSAGCDAPLPIGYGQTVSQPSLVYRMVELLSLMPSHRVLEIGTGSGYQTAFLAEFAGTVYTVERIAPLSALARQRLDLLGYRNIVFNVSDGSDGWAEHAPYDRIIASCASSSVPQPLLDQLSPGGILIIPVGSRYHQELMEIRKNEHGVLSSRSVLPVVFVEFTGRYGW
ncbi:MAG: protein-L-isoaspartate(D-aspartate) O-methyltransferase [Saccharofermentanales bacterium]